MAHDFSSVTNLTSHAASRASTAKSAIGSHTDKDIAQAINELAEAVNILADAVNSAVEVLNRS